MRESHHRLRTALADRYQITREAGSGGMAVVYLAEDLRHARQVALKVLRAEVATSIAHERFHREIEIAARLQHPHILPLYDSGEYEGAHYYVMPYVEGESLRDRLERGGPLPIEEALQWTREVASALDYAHQEGVIHRDIKPENILISRGFAVVADFGIARAVNAARGDALTATGVPLGTPPYMSPEQISGDHDVNGRTDQYALACVLYEMLTGERAFGGKTIESVIAKHLIGTPPPVSEFRPEVPPAVSDAVAQALAKNPDQRFATVAEFAAQLAPSAALRRPRLPMTITALIGIVAIALGMAVWAVLPREARRGPPRVVVLPFENVGGPEDEYLADGITEAVTTRLAAIRGLAVVSFQGARRFKGSAESPRTIGNSLDVGYLVYGRLQRARPSDRASPLRISPELVRAANETTVWSSHYDIDSIGNVFNMYAHIGREVALRLDVALLDPERQTLALRPTESEEAYDLYLRGKDHFRRRIGEEDSRRAIELFEEAAQADHDFAEAHAALAHALAWYAWDFAGEEVLPAARQAIELALALAPNRTEVQLAAGYYSYYGSLDYDQALQQFSQVVAREPRHADAITAVGLIRRRQGYWGEAVGRFEQALTLNPQDYFVAILLGQTYGGLRNFEQGERYLNRATSIAPALAQAYVEKAWLYAHWDGNTGRPWQVVQDASSRVDDEELRPLRTWLHLLDGDYASADRLASLAPVVESPERGRWLVSYLSGERELARAQADSARVVYEPLIAERPSKPQLHAYLGAAYAVLGSEGAAVEAAERAVRVRADAFTGTVMLWNLATVRVLLGQTGAALAALERLHVAPFRLVIPPLALDPMWESLKEQPRFRALLATGND